MAWTFLIVDGKESESARTAQQLKVIQPAAEVLIASSGDTALALLEERRLIPSLMFVDFALADMNGFEFLGKVRQRRWLERAAVAMLSEPVADKFIVNSYRLGACAFIQKPARTHELRETVRDFALPARQMTVATVVQGSGGSPSARVA
ncbi:MAG: response regulator [Dehalococcoidia bacterium]|nr:response regulator [Dehalococcoidia bacterium]